MKKKLLWIAIVLVGIVASVASVASGGSDTAKSSSGDKVAAEKTSEADEVKITACEKDDLTGWVNVKGTATNGSSKRSDYYFDIVVEDASGVQLASTVGIAENVEPSQTAQWDSPTDAEWAEGVTCRVVDVNRDASL